MSEDFGVLASQKYGKDLVRVARVVRDGNKQTIVEYTVCLLMEGKGFTSSYTEADNKMVITTDSVKNTIYCHAKTSPHVLTPELFALHLGLHYLKEYDHVEKCNVDVTMYKWSRIVVDGREHDHSFVRDGEEKRIIKVIVDGTASKTEPTAFVQSGIKDLLVLKTGGSSFTDFWTDKWTTLKPTEDRIFSTSVDMNYIFHLPPNTPLTIENLPAIDAEVKFEEVAASARKVTLDVFATDESASVQATLYKTAQKLMSVAPSTKEISYAYPNKHYMPVNLAPFGLENGNGVKGGVEVFEPVASPSGLICATITRK